MTTWTPEGLSPRGPMYLAIADALARDVAAGALSPGERLPTHRALARGLGVNVVTVTRAYAEAARRGLVDGEVGRGTFVSRLEPNGAHLALLPQGGDTIDLHFNLPAGDPGLVDLRELYGSLAREGFHPMEADYAPAGRREHREAGAAWIARSGVEADPARVFVTSGGQHAMSVAFATLTGPGDTLLVEELTYPGMKALASVLHLRTVPVALDEEGIRPDALENACRKGNPKALYCMPTLQNPTGIVWSEERRHEVVAIARRYGLVIVEDDTTAFLVDDPPPPLARIAPEQVVFVASTSKSIGPGLRLGYLHLPACERGRLHALSERTAANLAALSWMTAPLMAEITSRLIGSGVADRIVAWKRAEADARRELFDDLLGHLETSSHPRSSFLWTSLPAPWRCGDFVEQARRAGVAVTPAEAFVVGRAQAPHVVRISIGTPVRRADVRRGLELLAGIVGRAPEVCRALV